MTESPLAIARESRRSLHYSCRGSGPAVVLVHGWCLSRRVWMYLEQALVEAGRRVISVDLAGYGDSAGLEPRSSLTANAQDIEDLLDELDLEEATLIGFADGLVRPNAGRHPP
jgi:non-heme chloroperoxidase